MLEKACAKILGSYSALEHYKLEEAIEIFYGVPSESKFFNETPANDIWDDFIDLTNNSYIIVVSTSDYGLHKLGLKENLSCSILGIFEADIYKIIKLRNSWGAMTWKGEFSNNSILWNEKIKKLVGYRKQDIDILYMRIEDLIKYFKMYTIGYIRKKWMQTTISVNCDGKHSKYIEFQIEKQMEICIRLHPKMKRYSDERGERQTSFNGLKVILILSKEEDSKLTYICKRSVVLSY